MTGLTQVLALEQGLGVTTGHDAVKDFVARTWTNSDPDSMGPPHPAGR